MRHGRSNRGDREYLCCPVWRTRSLLVLPIRRGLDIADYRDIAVQKAYTLGRRAQARDYLDLHAVLQAGFISFDDLLRWTQETYHEAFSARLFLQQLTYTRDIVLSLLTTLQSFEAIERDLQINGQRHALVLFPRHARDHSYDAAFVPPTPLLSLPRRSLGHRPPRGDPHSHRARRWFTG